MPLKKINQTSAVFNKSWKQHLTKQQLCSHLPPISQTIQVRHADKVSMNL